VDHHQAVIQEHENAYKHFGNVNITTLNQWRPCFTLATNFSYKRKSHPNLLNCQYNRRYWQHAYMQIIIILDTYFKILQLAKYLYIISAFINYFYLVLKKWKTVIQFFQPSLTLLYLDFTLLHFVYMLMKFNTKREISNLIVEFLYTFSCSCIMAWWWLFSGPN